MDSSPALGRVTISSTVSRIVSKVVWGTTSWIAYNRVCWKCKIGIKGMMVKKKSSDGKMARKKLNEIDEALEVRSPS